MIRTTAIALSLTLASPVLAGDFLLDIPVDCGIGEDQGCFIQHYVDRDAGPARRDVMCRTTLTYDGHGGTDFALRSWADMEAGVDVLAAAAGTVRAVRDGVEDIEFDPVRDAVRIEGRDCGNGVVVEHGDGWQTQYCHLRQNSVSVRPGDTVSAGDKLGLVGMSGRAQFPHLHLHVRQNGVVIDPFAPNPSAQCGDRSEAIFQTAPDYAPGGMIAAGFSTAIPDYERVKAGTAHLAEVTDQAPAVVIWGFAYGSEPGDTLRLTIQAPTGETLFTHDAVLDRAQAQVFRAAGQTKANADWFAPGSYTGTASLLRAGEVISDMHTDLVITSR